MSRFDNVAKEWDKNKRRVDLAKTVADNIKKIVPIKKDFKILDFGCGTGLLSYNFENDVKEIVGIDLSSKMVEEFNKKSKSKKIKAYCKDIENLDEKFDLIISSMTFHHIKDIEKIGKILKDRLNKDGYLCIADLESEDGTFHDKGNEGVYHFGFDIENLSKIFSKIGFKLINKNRVYTIKKHKDFYIFLLCVQKIEN
ncbi:class I SAM-dependent DNA methyltransferase [Nitrosophilus kaiyonis]|uniref:class I SAM-dependent DNA methyltransferase n=1 Tax=Nitrosophilus kaiyonis TaxID=2930200 RepID=UPI00249280FF|nr:class I SAM-dependent methyltransferase [Nitrosophilus kaiyonis]